MANRTIYRARKYQGIAHPIMTFEYHCFGYRKGGHDRQVIDDGTETEVVLDFDAGTANSTTKHKSHIEKTAYFVRHEEYPKNILFSLLEFVMTIISVIRVLIGKWLIVGYAACSAEIIDGIGGYAPVIGGWILMLYGASLLVPIAGLIVRKVFKLDEKMDEVCEENNWKKWSQYRDQ